MSITEKALNHVARRHSNSVIKLPKLPTPSLNVTLNKYLEAVEGVVSVKDFQRTSSLVNRVLNKTNVELNTQLQKELESRGRSHSNWAYEWWIDEMYLGNKLPLPVNSNPGWLFPKQNFNHDVDLMIGYVARIIGELLHSHDILQRHEWPGDQNVGSHGTANVQLCMKQHYRLMDIYRKPLEHGDIQHVKSSRRGTNNSGKHILVMLKNEMFIVNVLNESTNEFLSHKKLCSILKMIHNQGSVDVKIGHPEDKPLGLLTTLPRREWAKAWQALCETSLDNASNLEMIQQCMFVVCLDELSQNVTDEKRGLQNQMKQVLFGTSPYLNGCNRWFDHTIQVICSLDGTNGVCYEHSVAEGVALVQLFEKVMRRVNEWKKVQSDFSNLNIRNEEELTVRETDENNNVIVNDTENNSGRENFKQLQWKKSDNVNEHCFQAFNSFEKLCMDTDIEIVHSDSFGKGLIKSYKCSPDAFLQIALQLAYYKCHSELTFTYESGSTRKFEMGRVENIRASHMAALRFVESVESSSRGGIDNNRQKCVALLKAALEFQAALTKECINGMGVDIPLMGYRELLKLKKKSSDSEVDRFKDLYDLFHDSVYRDQFNSFKLSTSQVTIEKDCFDGTSMMGYGPVVEDGYGVSYNLQPDCITFVVTSLFHSSDTDSRLMTSNILLSLQIMKDLLTNSTVGNIP